MLQTKTKKELVNQKVQVAEHRITEAQNELSWEQPPRIIESTS